jgi:hypothetical protein
MNFCAINLYMYIYIYICPAVQHTHLTHFADGDTNLFLFGLNIRLLWSYKSYRNIHICLSFFVCVHIMADSLEFAYFNSFHYYTIVEIYWAEDQVGILILRHTLLLHVCNIRSIVPFLFIIGLNSAPNKYRWGYAQYTNTSSNISADCGYRKTSFLDHPSTPTELFNILLWPQLI